jgi:hypothetical protein
VNRRFRGHYQAFYKNGADVAEACKTGNEYLMKIAILQSNYIPWKGYFDIINSVDEFVIYDDAQYTRRDWRNRNLIKTKDGLKWLTIPVEVKGRYNQKIKDVRVANKGWINDHWETIKHCYCRTSYFEVYNDLFASTYNECKKLDFLSDINRIFIDLINSILGIKTNISNSIGYGPEGTKNEKIITICKKAKADVYLSGPSAKSYLDEKVIFESGINVEWVKYDEYPEYRQLYPPFEHKVSVIDLIFNHGEKSPLFMKSF